LEDVQKAFMVKDHTVHSAVAHTCSVRILVY